MHRDPQRHPNLPEPPSATARRLYYDTVCYGSQAAFYCAYQAFGATTSWRALTTRC